MNNVAGEVINQAVTIRCISGLKFGRMTGKTISQTDKPDERLISNAYNTLQNIILT